MNRSRFVVICLLATSPLHADGGLDPSFGTLGKLRTTLSPTGSGVFTAVAHQADGKIVAAGSTQGKPMNPPVIILMRFTHSGALDTTFGTNGIARTGLASEQALTSSIAVQRDGRILLTASVQAPPAATVAVLFRFEKNGSLDRTFGVDGRVPLETMHGDDGGRLFLDSAGRILIVGTLQSANYGGIEVVRRLPNGAPDLSFGDQGRVWFSTSASNLRKGTALIRPDGKIFIAGTVATSTSKDFFVARLHPDGSVDPSFGFAAPSIDFQLFHDDSVAAIVPGDAGSIILCGTSADPVTGNRDFALAKLTEQGMPDSTFGASGTGRVRVDVSQGSLDSIFGAVRLGNRIVAAGSSEVMGNTDVALARFSLDGELDVSFGSAGTGILRESFEAATTEIPLAASVSPDGRLVVAGGVFESYFAQDFALLRFGAPCLQGFIVTAPSASCPEGEGTATVRGGLQGATYQWSIQNGTVLSGQGTSTLRYRAGAVGTTSLSVIVNSGACEANGSASTFVDASGCTAALGFHTLAPCRAVDTRLADGPSAGPSLPAGGSRRFSVAGTCGVPADARAVAANVTVLNASTFGSLSAFAEGLPSPPTSVNAYRPGEARATFAQLALGENGAIRIESTQLTGSADVLVDVSGYYK